jgi:rhodanese-related sulfurtransferase
MLKIYHQNKFKMMNLFRKLFASAPEVDFKQLTKNGAVIIDVRTPSEYNEGHIQKALNIPLDQVGQQLSRIRQLNKPVITVCRSGSRSAMAKGIIEKAGIEVYNGGGWNSFEKKIS